MKCENCGKGLTVEEIYESATGDGDYCVDCLPEAEGIDKLRFDPCSNYRSAGREEQKDFCVNCLNATDNPGTADAECLVMEECKMGFSYLSKRGSMSFGKKISRLCQRGKIAKARFLYRDRTSKYGISLWNPAYGILREGKAQCAFTGEVIGD